MDIVNNYTGYLFSLPVALTFSNSSEVDGFAFNMSEIPRETNHSWKKDGVTTNGPQRTEKIGETLRKELKWAFILHTYGFGCLFFILAFYTFFSVLNIRSFISSRPFMSTINGFLCLLGVSRAASLFIDPYNLKENMPKLIGQVLWDIGFPSIISAFCLVQLAFLQLTQLQVGAEGLRRKSCLSLIVTAHFLLTIGMDIVVASHENLTVVKHVIQYVFLAWGVFLCSNFLYSGYKVMSMIRSVPGGLKPRDLPDSTYKGIMQLAILAPHNNLAGSMTAALIPTLCAPKIHQQDNITLSAVGFRSDGNSRILESESIPMLEEMTGSSGDEMSSKSLTRGPSFQNQTRNSQKFKSKPKLSLKSIPSSKSKEEELEQEKFTRPKSPKSPTPTKSFSPRRLAPGKLAEFDFNVKPSNGFLKQADNFVTTRNVYEVNSKIRWKTSFENENFHFKNDGRGRDCENWNKADGGKGGLIPDMLVSCSSASENDKEEANEKMQENLNKIMNEITNDLNEMRIVREGKSIEPEEVAEVHKLKKGKTEFNPEIPVGNGMKPSEESFNGREGSQTESVEIRRSSSRKENSTSEAGLDGREKASSVLTGLEEALVISEKVNRRKAAKSLSWKKKEINEEEIATQECLLPQENPTDASLRSVLNHIAYINRGAPSNLSNEEDLEKVRKSKVEWVLNVTYITAMWGLMLCLSNMGRIYSPFEAAQPHETRPLNSTRFPDVGGRTEEKENGILFSSWPWLWFQTFCRALELAMGCAMANITRQPTANHRYGRTLSLRHRDTFYTM